MSKNVQKSQHTFINKQRKAGAFSNLRNKERLIFFPKKQVTNVINIKTVNILLINIIG